jgi:hypothetical protein
MTPLLLIAWVVLFIATYRVGRHKGHEFLGVALGVLAPVLGLVILAICPMTEEARARHATEKLKALREAERRLQAGQ